MDNSISQVIDENSEYSDSRLVRQITAHPILKDEKYLKMFLTANFGKDPKTSLQFSSFLPTQLTPGTLPTYSARREYTNAAASFEIAARVFYSKVFIDVMKPILLILSGQLDTLSLVPDNLLLWTIERTFNKWGKIVRTEIISTEFPTISLESSSGCATLLTSMLIADLMLLSGESLYLQERFFRTTCADQTTDMVPSTKQAIVKEQNEVTTLTTHCRFHMAHLLNALVSDGSKIKTLYSADIKK